MPKKNIPKQTVEDMHKAIFGQNVGSESEPEVCNWNRDVSFDSEQGIVLFVTTYGAYQKPF